jgi:hypothetical protein
MMRGATQAWIALLVVVDQIMCPLECTGAQRGPHQGDSQDIRPSISSTPYPALTKLGRFPEFSAPDANHAAAPWAAGRRHRCACAIAGVLTDVFRLCRITTGSLRFPSA